MAGTFFLVDGTALAYRSHFAFINNPLTNAKGQETSATFGYTRGLLQILRDYKPDSMAVAFDVSRETFRKELYPEYKATREKAPRELKHQYAWMREITEALGIPILEQEGFEADDLIGSAAKAATRRGFKVVIVSGDKDMLQLINDAVAVLDMAKRGGPVMIDADGVAEKFGVPPQRVTDLFGLMGDSSDNVPGVPGIGPKKAAQLLGKFGTMESVLEQAPAQKPSKTNQNLIDNADLARLSKELVTIKTDIDLDLEFELGERDSETLATMFDELDFHGLREEIAGDVGERTSGETYRVVEDANELVPELRQCARFVFDVETDALDPYSAGIVGLSFAWKEGDAVYVPWSEANGEALKPVLEDASIGKAGQNIKYDAHVMLTHGIDVKPLAFDTMVASYILESERGSHGLDAMSLRHLGVRKTTTEELIGKGRNRISMADVEQEKVAHYAAEDADCTFRLLELFEPRLAAAGLRPLFDEIEMPLVPVLLAMERAGVKVDTDYLGVLSKEMEDVAFKREVEIHDLAGEVFNINSPKQLGPILFDKLEIHKSGGQGGRRSRSPRRTRTGGYSTDHRALEPYHDHPIVAKLLEYREITKLKGTYVDALPLLVNEKTGRIHTTFHQTVAATGRLASSDPNLQNIPVRTELGRRVRRAFVAEKGNLLLSADYSQIELRLMAHMSEDEALVEVYTSGGDIHAETASRMFGIAPGDLTRDQRNSAKAINFGILYGMGPQRLARDLKITLDEARSFLETYFREFPRVKDFQLQAVETAREQGYVTTLLDRKRVIVDIDSNDPGRRASAENMAKNTPLQGTAADLIKIAMVRIQRRLADEKLGARMLLQVHDELVFEAPAAEIEQLSGLVRSEMEGALELRVPLVAEVGTGENWLEAH
ncbi:MAG: DNA polymerase I [Planctomycetota bacterium]|jgi:DNA polymerase-1